MAFWELKSSKKMQIKIIMDRGYIMMDIITLCGSMKFKNEMIGIASKLSFKGYCVLMPVFLEKDTLTEEEVANLKNAHLKKIECANTILVMNINNYIGASTAAEIQYATKLGKKIVYYTDVIKN